MHRRVLLFLPGAALWLAPEAAGGVPAPGRPRVVVDRVELPAELPVRDRLAFEKALRRALTREARRVSWGAGRGSTISFRFRVTELSVTEDDGVLRVRCTAVGLLPGGKRAKGSLSFGGEPGQRAELVTRVTDIVARGVVVRLAELERERRGER